jgi:hypothetical protein
MPLPSTWRGDAPARLCQRLWLWISFGVGVVIVETSKACWHLSPCDLHLGPHCVDDRWRRLDGGVHESIAVSCQVAAVCISAFRHFHQERFRYNFFLPIPSVRRIQVDAYML